VREAGLGLPVADLVVAGQAARAAAAGADERHGHPVTDPPTADLGADARDRPRQLVPRHVREHDVGVVPLPAVPVAAADAGGAHPHHDPGRRRLGDGHLPDRERSGEVLEDEGPHYASCCISCRAASVTEPDSDG
jgi:hypothetical protein